MLQLTILCTDPRHPINRHLEQWAASMVGRASVRIIRRVVDAGSGDFLFLVSCQEIVSAEVRRRFRHALVLHASALPEGRGMSPHVWQILEGRTEIAMTLLEAVDEVDAGSIWSQILVHVPHSALFPEINEALFAAEIDLLTWAVAHCDQAEPRPQSGVVTRYPRRTPNDSRIDPNKSLAESFNLIRVSDPERYPAHFTLHGRTFRITLDPIS